MGEYHSEYFACRSKDVASHRCDLLGFAGDFGTFGVVAAGDKPRNGRRSGREHSELEEAIGLIEIENDRPNSGARLMQARGDPIHHRIEARLVAGRGSAVRGAVGNDLAYVLFRLGPVVLQGGKRTADEVSRRDVHYHSKTTEAAR